MVRMIVVIGSKGESVSVFCYVRVSTQEQATKGVSIAAQYRTIRDYCHKKELDPPRGRCVLIDVGISAKIPLLKRPKGRMIQFMRPGDHLIVTALDRAFRSTIDGMTHIQRWVDDGIKLHILNLGGHTVDASTPMGKLFVTIILAVAQAEREMIAARTQGVLDHRKANGYMDHRIGKLRPPGRYCPLGYKRVLFGVETGSRRTGKPIWYAQECPEDIATIKMVAEWRKTTDWSWAEIERLLVGMGIKTWDGKKWTASKLQKWCYKMRRRGSV